MGLTDYLTKAIERTRASFSSDRDRMMNYLKKYELKSYFSDDLPEEVRMQREGRLEQMLQGHITKYDGELEGMGRKVVSKTSMGLGVLNDLYAYVSNVPILNVTQLGWSLFVAKSVAEAPALYKYIRKSGDWYGAITHLALKPVRYLLPVIGPALESGAFDRMVRKNVIKETKLSFIKEFGDYKPIEDQISEHLSRPVAGAIYRPPRKAA